MKKSCSQLLTARTIDSTFTCIPCYSGTITMYTRADLKIPQQSVSKSHPFPKTTTTTTTSSTRRDATRPTPLSTPSPRPQTLQAPAPLKNESTNTLMGQYQKTHTGPHTQNPYRIISSIQIQKATKPKAICRRKTPPHQPGGKRGGENLLGGYDESARTRSQRSFWWW